MKTDPYIIDLLQNVADRLGAMLKRPDQSGHKSHVIRQAYRDVLNSIDLLKALERTSGEALPVVPENTWIEFLSEKGPTHVG
ncbi:hypothetical protein TRICHSKD4_2740 [Roseibium sp. TrichSKD4]|uniref:hypothetical protein n=1 Tax=Roseibium sp. TrichSKD4 TaxID=744980 RepID=UPI0001E57060|nr:hypothetical protein [Roseibium sp. TrichSKD4]EFO31653.1 hypothetical protein TRICHSKD4_2740 [Roseibium sp. TrichSKD4]